MGANTGLTLWGPGTTPVTCFRDDLAIFFSAPLGHSEGMSSVITPEAPKLSSILESKLAQEMDISGSSSTVDFTGGTESGRSQATRDGIMDAARVHFLEHGFQSTRLANVARDAYVAPSTVSLHFKGKEALFAACLVQDVERLLTLAQRVTDGNPVAHTSGEFIRVLARLLPTFPLLATAITLSPHRWGRPFYDNVHLEALVSQLEKELRELQADGIVRADLDPHATARDLFRARVSALWTVVATHSLEARSLEFLLEITTDAILTPGGRDELDARAAMWRHRALMLAQRVQAPRSSPDCVPAA